MGRPVNDPPRRFAPPPIDVQAQLAAMQAAPPGEMTPANANDASKDFAAILFGYMFSQMRSQDGEDALLGGGDAEMFMSYLDDALGKDLAQGSGNQLVAALENELGATTPQNPKRSARKDRACEIRGAGGLGAGQEPPPGLHHRPFEIRGAGGLGAGQELPPGLR
ncbi:MAG: hypothetical protein KGR26_02345 [Cyanobacteria bacterium REEB65]|nr:hypothetical protein [Cyanobacteria bacterium REEB65]